MKSTQTGDREKQQRQTEPLNAGRKVNAEQLHATQQTSTDIYRQAQHGFILCDRLHHMVFEKYMKHIAHRSQHGVLLYLHHNGGTAWQKEIAEAMDVTPAAMTGTVKKLEKSGYITKTIFDKDNRQNRITLTPAGSELLRRGKQQFEQINQKMFVGIDDSDLACFVKCLQQMEENLYDMLRDTETHTDTDSAFFPKDAGQRV